ncbi:hypothetical protein EMIHUDRAFT_255107 [Emiliania huxleyi CCMP1516]|uniref:Uncharacterized protein n=2 Tax=Emiliania huxleyi TaxID=2903 RepID=A0A0D3JFX7_EMIH1|nr:hypothetical protein EMIHUDRAFT_255107 [Emiliania huxleyi CCMP1516]EOD22412.1 hypothetical protein EMIHUDRAFT_255107 [Emiliania huxleyi CCMP1516]|eukprot:XP_005774841.1 hypothetical protein EMIHUDRAFT_255107 [Emiliania huxleyi CCMP1516]
MASLTLEQVAGKRLKLLTDMGAQMAAEVRRGVAEEAAAEASQLVRIRLGLDRCAEGGAEDKRLKAPLGDKAEAYNDDVRFQAAVGDALKASRVDLSGFDLGDDGVMVGTAVAWMESEPSALTSLTLDWGNVCGRVREALLGAVRKTHTLVALNVGDELTLNPQQLCGREAVRSLDLSNKGLGPGSAAVVAAGLSVNGVLNVLDISRNDIGPVGGVAIAEALQGNEVLKELYLGSNSIGDEGANAIGAALRGNGVLTTLNLSFSDIGPAGGVAIGKALEVNRVLTDLNLSGNNINGETDYINASEVEGESKEVGAKVIYQGREMVVSVGVDSDGDLKLVDVVQTGVRAIAKALEVNGVLTKLSLYQNDIGDEGAKALASALRVNGVLKNIDLRYNELGDEGKGAIRDAASGRVGFELLM